MKKTKKNVTTQIGCVEIANFALEIYFSLLFFLSDEKEFAISSSIRMCNNIRLNESKIKNFPNMWIVLG